MMSTFRKSLEDRRARLEADPNIDVIADLDRRIGELREEQGALRAEREALNVWHCSQDPDLRASLSPAERAVVERFKDRHPSRLQGMVTENDEAAAKVAQGLRDLREAKGRLIGEVQAKRAEALKPEHDAAIERIANVVSTLEGFVADENQVRARMAGGAALPDPTLEGAITQLRTWVANHRDGEAVTEPTLANALHAEIRSVGEAVPHDRLGGNYRAFLS